LLTSYKIYGRCMSTHGDNQISPIVIEAGLLGNLGSHFSNIFSSFSSAVVISDHQLFQDYGKRIHDHLNAKGITCHKIIVPSGEKCKSLEIAQHCWKTMQSLGIDRKSVLIAVGGGAVCDLSGFVASCYMRGIPLINVPTSLLAMVDAAIGGKNGVNLNGKNLIGTFLNPLNIFIDTDCLSTLSETLLKDGLAEVIKYGIIDDPALLIFLENNMQKLLSFDSELIKKMILWSCSIKKRIVTQDPREHGLRATLNWGHTFAHAFETFYHDQGFSHGKAVAIGMSCAAHLSHQLEFANSQFVQRVDHVCRLAGLDTCLPEIPTEELVELMRRDKKATKNSIACVVAKEVGNVFLLKDIQPGEISQAIENKRHMDKLQAVSCH